MVHALKEALRVLAHNGILIDLRPIRSNQQLSLDSDGITELVATYTDNHRHAKDTSANEAITTILAENLCVLEDTADFAYHRQFDTADEFVEYCANRNPPLYFPESAMETIKRAMKNFEITLTYTTNISLKRYRKMNRV